MTDQLPGTTYLIGRLDRTVRRALEDLIRDQAVTVPWSTAVRTSEIISCRSGSSTPTRTTSANVGCSVGAARRTAGHITRRAEMLSRCAPSSRNTRRRTSPWVEEHIARDDEAIRRMRGGDLDLSQPLTTTAIVDAAQVEPRISAHLAGYMAMTELPSSLASAEPFARAVYETGWRPALSDGPTRDELVAAITERQRTPVATLAS